MPKRPPSPDDLLKPAEVARYFAVNTKTITRWALQGKLPFVTTLGGHRRYRRAVVERLAAEHTRD